MKVRLKAPDGDTVPPQSASHTNNLNTLLHVSLLYNCSTDVVQAVWGAWPEAIAEVNGDFDTPLHLRVWYVTTSQGVLTSIY